MQARLLCRKCRVGYARFYKYKATFGKKVCLAFTIALSENHAGSVATLTAELLCPTLLDHRPIRPKTETGSIHQRPDQ